MPPKMIGAPKMIRTSDTRFRKPLLYPLSYGRMLNITAAAAPRTMSRTAQPIFYLYVKPEIRDVAVAHDVIFAFESQHAFFTRFGHRTGRD